MDTNQEPQEVTLAPGETAQVTADVAPAKAQAKAPAAATPAVDNSAATGPNLSPDDAAPEAVDEPMQELPDSELPREVKAGVMGAERAQLMLLLGLDVNHPFDEYVEEQIRERVPEYDGTVTKAVWRVLFQENPVAVAK